MPDKILFLDVILKERLWGGDYLKKLYSQEQLQTNIGEAWLVSGHKEGQSTILNGTYKGQKLNDVYLKHRYLFGNSNHDRFPLLIKYIDALEDLSIQVHPDDSFALKTHGDLGKTECWYVLDADKNSYIIDGHNAKDLDDFKDMFSQGKYDDLFSKRKVKQGDFIFIPAGLIHAIGGGIKILEVQQSSDVTYRLYDYDRIDSQGGKRKLHFDAALECIKFNKSLKIEQPKIKHTNHNLVRLISCDKFTIDMFNIDHEIGFVNNDYAIIYVIKGQGYVSVDDEKYQINENSVFIVTNNATNFKISGNLQILHIKENEVEINNILDSGE